MNKEKPDKKRGKRAEPTSEELEFIYERLPVKSDKDIIDDMQDETTFPPRGIGFIKRRRKEFNVLKMVSAKRAEGAYDTDRIERQKRHWTRLAERAQELLDELKTFFPYTKDYTIADAITSNDDDYEFATLLEDFRSYCLLSHIKAELSEFENLKSWPELKISDIPLLISTLGLRAENQQFVGKCGVCEDWE